MRMTLSLLAATAVHGALFGVAAVFLLQAAAKDPVLVPVEVEVIAARPDPIADTPPGPVTAAPSRSPASAPVRPRVVRRPREVALVGNPDSISVREDPSAVADAPAVPAAAPPASSSPAAAGAVRAPSPAGPSGVAPLSAKLRYRTNPKPDYPIPSVRRREEGIVLVNVQVAPDGTPAAVSLNRSCGHPLLDRSALDAMRRSTFEPARVAGVPVSSLFVQSVRFSLDDR